MKQIVYVTRTDPQSFTDEVNSIAKKSNRVTDIKINVVKMDEFTDAYHAFIIYDEWLVYSYVCKFEFCVIVCHLFNPRTFMLEASAGIYFTPHHHTYIQKIDRPQKNNRRLHSVDSSIIFLGRLSHQYNLIQIQIFSNTCNQKYH